MLTREDMTGYISNSECRCFIYDDETGEERLSEHCLEFCWDEMLDDFKMTLDEWFEAGDFLINDFPVWYGTISGEFECKTIDDFIWKVTPDRSEWNLHYDIDGDNFVGVLSHHDGSGYIYVTKAKEDCYAG